MKIRIATLALGLFLPLVRPAEGAVLVYIGTLTGAAENPTNGSPGTGTTTVTYDNTAHTLRVQVSFSGLTGTTTASHIHCCVAAPGNIGVATTTPSFVGFPLGVTSGSMDQTYDLTLASSWNPSYVTANGGTPSSAETTLATGLAAGQAYLNIHSSTFAGGEIRAFLVFSSPVELQKLKVD